MRRHRIDGVVVVCADRGTRSSELRTLGFDIPIISLEEEGLRAERSFLHPEAEVALRIIMESHFNPAGGTTRRRHKRHKVNLGAWWGSGASLQGGWASSVFGQIRNLSFSGACIEAEPTPAIGEVLAIQFVDPIRGGLTSAPAIVRWVGEKSSFGVEFVSVDEDAADVINNICAFAEQKSGA